MFSLLKLTVYHNAFRHCHVRFYASFGQPFSKQLYIHLSVHHLWVYYKFTTWPAPSWLDSSVGRALYQYCRGHGFESHSTATVMINHVFIIFLCISNICDLLYIHFCWQLVSSLLESCWRLSQPFFFRLFLKSFSTHTNINYNYYFLFQISFYWTSASIWTDGRSSTLPRFFADVSV